jgi:hypothetical protein
MIIQAETYMKQANTVTTSKLGPSGSLRETNTALEQIPAVITGKIFSMVIGLIVIN